MSLYAIAKKVGISNNGGIIYLCKTSCNPWSQCKCHKNKIKCSQYCHLAKQDCGNAVIVEESIDIAIVSRSKSGEDNPQASLNISILPHPQLSKAINHHWINTTFSRKPGEFDIEAITEVEDALSVNERDHTIL